MGRRKASIAGELYQRIRIGADTTRLHHARKFAETAAPGDPMLEQLSAMMGVNLRVPAVGIPAGSP